MKRLKYLIIALLLFIPIIGVDASCINSDGSGKTGSVSLSSSSLSVNVGKTTTFKINAPCAAGRITISSSDSSIATVTPTSEFLDDSSLTVTVKGKAAGKVTISVSLDDVADYASNVISGTKKVTVTVKSPTTTTKKTTTTTTKAKTSDDATTKTTTTTKKTTTTTTTQAPKEIIVNTFEIVGYDINFIPTVQEYNLNVDSNVKKLYIKVNGENFNAMGDGEVDIEGKDSVTITLSNNNQVIDYKINIIRTKTEVKEVVKEVVKMNNTFLYTTILLAIVCVVLLILLIKSKSNNKNSVVENPPVGYTPNNTPPVSTTTTTFINPAETTNNAQTITSTFINQDDDIEKLDL